MKSNFITCRRVFESLWLFLFFVCVFGIAPVQAQEEGEPIVVDEVIVQVNNDVVTLSSVRREARDVTDGLVQRGMEQAKANEEVARRQPEIIASLITEQLLLQKGKELNLTEKVEAEVNRRLLDLAKQQGITKIEDLEQAMRNSNVDPATFRASARRSIMTSLVLNQEVDGKIYFGLRPEEVRKYYDANQAKFRKAETLTLSEIFLSTTGKQETDVRARAAQLVAQARAAGADFGALAAANSEREGTRAERGKIGAVSIEDVTRPEIANAVKPLKAGSVTDPIKTEEGFLILRVDERAGASAPTFNENQVREALTYERSPDARKAYLRELREQSFIKVAEGYRAGVETELNKAVGGTDPAKTATPAAVTTATPVPARTTATPAANSVAPRKP